MAETCRGEMEEEKQQKGLERAIWKENWEMTGIMGF